MHTVSFRIGAPVALLCLSLCAVAQQKPQLPDASGKETVKKLCGTCHGAEIVLGKPHSEDGWGAIVADMVQRGAKGTDDEFYEVIEYLTKNIKELPKINVNKADTKELATAFDIPEKDAEAIIQAREKTPFKSVDDVKKVPGIDAAKIDAQKARIEF